MRRSESAARQSESAESAKVRIPGKRRVHCGYHKCLTMYVRNVFDRLCQPRFYFRASFRHFYHRLDTFYAECGNYDISSISGHCLDLDRFNDVRVSRFVRDPRDLLVSGYFYHKRGAEGWSRIPDPTDTKWRQVRGAVPSNLPRGRSLMQFLEDAPLEDGLFAELEFRRHHFQSMREWPDDDPRVLLFRYEDIVGNEVESFDRLFRHYQLPLLARRRGLRYVERYRAERRAPTNAHIRNANAGQWREHFTPALERRFLEQYGDLVDRLGYAR